MPLCGSSSCGCALVSVPAASGEVNGVLPTIDVAGSGTPSSPWNLTLNDEWVAAVASFLSNIKAATVLTSQSTASATYVDLATAGPAVSCVTGDSALVIWSAWISSTSAGSTNLVAVEVSGATAIAAADVNALYMYDPATGSGESATNMILLTGLTPGTNTFTLKYRVNAGTGSFYQRNILVIPIL